MISTFPQQSGAGGGKFVGENASKTLIILFAISSMSETCVASLTSSTFTQLLPQFRRCIEKSDHEN